MKRNLKLFLPFLLIVMMVVFLGACGTSLEKPTGLEEKETEHVEVNDLEKPDKNKKDSEATQSKQDSEEEERTEKKTKTNESKKSEKAGEEKTEKSERKISKGKPVKEKKQTETNKEKETPAKSSSKKKSTSSSDSKKSPDTSKKEKKPSKESSPPKDKEQKPDGNKQEDSGSTITQSIVISSNEVPLSPTKMTITDEDTVLQALIQITKANRIHMDYRGGQGATAYVEGMGNVYEFDRGQGSGWMYRINGIFPDRGAGVVPLCEGDKIEWVYTTNLGEDLGADLKSFRRDGKCP